MRLTELFDRAKYWSDLDGQRSEDVRCELEILDRLTPKTPEYWEHKSRVG